MFLGASPLIFERARLLRKNQTQAELVLWEYLRKHPFGKKFRRQHPLKIYIVDFYCHQLKLVIEVDGAIHDQEQMQVKDMIRQKSLESDGLIVLRIRNEDIFADMHKVIEKVNEVINEILLHN